MKRRKSKAEAGQASTTASPGMLGMLTSLVQLTSPALTLAPPGPAFTADDPTSPGRGVLAGKPASAGAPNFDAILTVEELEAEQEAEQEAAAVATEVATEAAAAASAPNLGAILTV